MEIEGLGKKNILFEKHRCILNRNNNVRCGQCLAVCPTKAIDMSEGQIVYNELNCQNCGACRAVCPTEAFTVNSLTFLSEICSSTEDELPLGCTLNNANKRDFNVSCYALLTEGELLYLLSKKKRIVFYTENCEGCGYLSGFKSFLGHLGIVNGMLKDNTRILFSSGNSGHKGIGRRHFFGWLQRKILTVVADSLPGNSKEPGLPIPKRRQTLILGVKNLQGELQETTFIREINAHNSCSGCGGCVKVCPCDALTLDSNSLSWLASSCMNCKLCTVTCPEKALFFGRYLPLKELFIKKTLVEYSGKRCSFCGTFFSGETEMCERCSSKRKLDLFCSK
ncbi:MAG: 4Fe-4S binding protein [Firmicutes bacterium]|nr:4Fe-4S binding protein [Bacillota bacterium]